MAGPPYDDDPTVLNEMALWRLIGRLWVVADENRGGRRVSSAAFYDSPDGSPTSYCSPMSSPRRAGAPRMSSRAFPATAWPLSRRGRDAGAGRAWRAIRCPRSLHTHSSSAPKPEVRDVAWLMQRHGSSRRHRRGQRGVDCAQLWRTSPFVLFARRTCGRITYQKRSRWCEGAPHQVPRDGGSGGWPRALRARCPARVTSRDVPQLPPWVQSVQPMLSPGGTGVGAGKSVP